MNLIARIAGIAVGLSLAGWLVLIAYDLNRNYERFERMVERRAVAPSRSRRSPGTG